MVSRWRPDGYTDPQPLEDPLVLSLRNTLRPPRIPEQSSETQTDSSASDKGNYLLIKLYQVKILESLVCN